MIARAQPAVRRTRLGFLGVGWIGQSRLRALAESGLAELVALADSSAQSLEGAQAVAPEAARVASLDELLARDLEGLVIATPSALHAEQALAALERGVPVFCQKPLGRDGAETARVVRAAEAQDLLLGVDLSYRCTAAGAALHELVSGGALGDIYAVNLVFHNAYGPDKPWFYDRRLSGGGCLVDLGLHLVDLALWCLGFPVVSGITGQLRHGGAPLGGEGVEDHACALLEMGGASVQLACSWRLPAGCDAVIEASFYGTRGGASLRNVNGSFYDFTTLRFEGTRQEVVAAPPDAWSGRAAVDWLARLAAGGRFDPEAWRFAEVARVLDGIYAAAGRHRSA
jgi:predicted dehydrogenase